MKIAILGGDRREKILSELLIEKGYKVKVLSDIAFHDKDIEFYRDYKNLIKDVDILYAPLSGVDNQGFLKSSFKSEGVKVDNKLLSKVEKKTLFLIGSINTELENILKKYNINYLETLKQPELAIYNAIPTAEAAIKIGIENTLFTLYGSNILITGLGKVGMTLAWRLKALGANVFAATRNKKAIARGRDLGIKMYDYEQLYELLSKIQIVYNTVPAQIIGENYLKEMKKNSLIIDLASAPGGVDTESAKKYGIRNIFAPGLPGKTAPESAAEILAEMLENIISEHF